MSRSWNNNERSDGASHPKKNGSDLHGESASGPGSLHFDIRLSSSRSSSQDRPKQKSSVDRIFDKHFAQVRDALELLEAYVLPDHVSKFDSVQRIIDESIYQAKKDANKIFNSVANPERSNGSQDAARE